VTWFCTQSLVGQGPKPHLLLSERDLHPPVVAISRFAVRDMRLPAAEKRLRATVTRTGPHRDLRDLL
jgi:hypothetical protein